MDRKLGAIILGEFRPIGSHKRLRFEEGLLAKMRLFGKIPRYTQIMKHTWQHVENTYFILISSVVR